MDPLLLVGGGTLLALLLSNSSAGAATNSPGTLNNGQPAGSPAAGNFADSRKVEAMFNRDGYYLGANLTGEAINYVVNTYLWHHCYFYLYGAAYDNQWPTLTFSDGTTIKSDPARYWGLQNTAGSMVSKAMAMGLGAPAAGPPTGTPVVAITAALVEEVYYEFCEGSPLPVALTATEKDSVVAYAKDIQAQPFKYMAGRDEVASWIGDYFDINGYFDAGGKLSECAIDVTVKGDRVARIGFIDPVSIGLLVSAGITLIPKIVDLFKKDKTPAFNAEALANALREVGADQDLSDEVASFVATGEVALAATQLAGGLRRGEATAFFTPVYYPGAGRDLLYVPTSSASTGSTAGTTGSNPGPSGDFFNAAANIIDLGITGLNLYSDIIAQEPAA